MIKEEKMKRIVWEELKKRYEEAKKTLRKSKC